MRASRFFLPAISLLLAFCTAQAQISRITHAVDTSLKKQNTYLGRDLWFTICKNADRSNKQYYTLYVTSPKNTVVNVDAGRTIVQPINAGQILSFDIPLAEEMETSSIVEQKAVHVWSTNADLSAYLLSHNDQSSDGMLIVPTTGWGTEYVIAGYASLQLGYAPGTYDYPSEFGIVANQNYTTCTITPHDDIRSGTDPNVIMHPAGVTFTETLMQGECVQYQTIPATATSDYDVTATHIVSNKPIGVVGASQCANVPDNYPYCDHVCDMLTPTRTWARTYQTVPFAGRKCGDTFKLLGTKDGQIITRYGASPTPYQYTINGSPGVHEENGIADASTWTSDEPFMLVQYINSSTWETECDPSNTDPKGDPSMVVINSVEQYASDIVFQTPSINTYVDYVNVMVADNAVKQTTFDGIPITSYPSTSQQTVPNSNYTAFQISNVLAGKHEVKSDSGTGVYIYGYGTGESYAWSGALGLRTFNDPDIINPAVRTSGDCFASVVSVTDNGPLASHISEMKLDSLYNMRYNPDPTYVIGIERDSTYYLMNVVDSTKEAYLQIEIHDYAGNRTLVTSTFKPQTISITPPVLNFGSGSVGVTVCKDFTVTNTGQVPYSWNALTLLSGNNGYAISSPDNSPIPIGGSRLLHICFTPHTGSLANDTLFISDGCSMYEALVTGTGGQADFAVTGEDFGCHIIGSTTIKSNASITNVSNVPIQIDNISVAPNTLFALNPPLTFPITIPANGELPVSIAFTPNTTGPLSGTLSVVSKQIGTKVSTLIACGIAPASRIAATLDTMTVCDAAVSFADTIFSTGSSATTIASIISTDTNFHLSPTLRTASGQFLGQLPISLESNDTLIAFFNFYPPQKASGVFQTKIFGISDLGDTTNFITTTVHAYYEELIAKTSVVIGRVAYGSPLEMDTAIYCNDLGDSVMISGAVIVTGAYSQAYSVAGYYVNGMSRVPPFSLAGGECLDLVFAFDPSYSTDTLQKAEFSLLANTCVPVPEGLLSAGTSIGAPNVQGFAITSAILSCDTKTDSVVITNSLPASYRITSITVKNHPGNFIAQPPSQTTLSGRSTLVIPVVFSPNPDPSFTQYSDTLIVQLTDDANDHFTLLAPISAFSGGMNVGVASAFSSAGGTAGGSIIKLPILISITKNQISNNISDAGITRITLQYSYKTNLLEPAGNDLSNSYFSANGWMLDPSSFINDQTGILSLTLKNSSPLSDGMTSLGEVHFYPTLTKSGTKETPLSLLFIGFQRIDSTTPVTCIGATVLDSSEFSIQYLCGDSTIAQFLATGNTPFRIEPANPDPVTGSNGSVVTFRFSLASEGVVSLRLFDALSREAARIIDGEFKLPGTYSVQYNVRNLASGVYVYRYELSSGFVATGKMIISN